jgi:hypothetical protein
MSEMQVESRRLEDLVMDDRNPRKGNVAAIIQSLKEFGQHRPIVVQKDTNRIIAGNHMFQAAQSLGWEEIQCVIVDDDDDKAIRRGIADNATSDLARWDDDQLKELLGEVGTDIAGIDDQLVKRLFAKIVDDSDPIYELVPKPGEKYDYVVLFADNDIDHGFLMTFFGEKVLDWKTPSRNAQRSRILPVSILRRLMQQHGLIPDTESVPDDFVETATPEPPEPKSSRSKKQ